MRENNSTFYENFHMRPAEFDKLFDMVEPLLLPKVRSHPKDEISPKEKLAIVLE